MEDKDVGELWHDQGGNECFHKSIAHGLIRKLVEERAELGYRRQGGKWPFIELTDRERSEWTMRALRDFGIDPKDWK